MAATQVLAVGNIHRDPTGARWKSMLWIDEDVVLCKVDILPETRFSKRGLDDYKHHTLPRRRRGV